MREYLIFQLYGPMASWGEIAVGEERPSSLHPGKSAILGLLAAAKGIKRDEDEFHRQMAEGYGIAVWSSMLGVMLRDFHTAQVPPETALKKCPAYTRKDELEALNTYNRDQSKSAGTILSRREYRCDASYGVGIWIKGKVPFSLHELKDAIAKPIFTLYLGRKSCPPALPLKPTIIQCNTLKEAIFKAKAIGPLDFLKKMGSSFDGLNSQDQIHIYWDHDEHIGLSPRESYSRWDQPLSRKRWQFAVRQESYTACQEE